VRKLFADASSATIAVGHCHRFSDMDTLDEKSGDFDIFMDDADVDDENQFQKNEIFSNLVDNFDVDFDLEMEMGQDLHPANEYSEDMSESYNEERRVI